MSFKVQNLGFTLIEVLVVMAIFAGLITVITIFGIDISKYNLTLSKGLSAQQELQESLRGMMAGIRSMGPANDGSYAIATATSTTFTFYTDLDDDGLFEKVKYYIENKTFKKSVIKPSGNPLTYNPANEKISELVHFVVTGASSSFSYYDKNYTGVGAPLTSPINIPLVRIVKISLLVDENPLALPGPIFFSTTAMIRNFRD